MNEEAIVEAIMLAFGEPTVTMLTWNVLGTPATGNEGLDVSVNSDAIGPDEHTKPTVSAIHGRR